MAVSLFDDIRGRVGARTLAALEEHTRALTGANEAGVDLLGPARSLLSGGKRLRAVLCVVGWDAAGGGDDPAPALHAGVAVELFQATALVHDDVMDGADLRRGMPSAHRRYARDHAERAWLGSSESYGVLAAILLGDLLLSVSSAEMERARDRVAHDAGRRARSVYDLMTAEVAWGQYLDVRSQHQPWPDPEALLAASLDVVRHKSARYSVEHPLRLGATLAGASPEEVEALAGVGLPLGEAFQLRDDELGVFGDPDVTGKPAGDDLREGKRTALVALTLARVAEADAAWLRERLGAPDLSAEEVERVRALMSSSGARTAHEDLIAARRGTAVERLRSLPLRDDVAEALDAVVTALTIRSA